MAAARARVQPDLSDPVTGGSGERSGVGATHRLDAKPKYVVSTTRRDSSWENTFHVQGDLRETVRRIKEKTPAGVLVGSLKLGAELQRLDPIDEYRLVVHPSSPVMGRGCSTGSRSRGSSSACPMGRGSGCDGCHGRTSAITWDGEVKVMYHYVVTLEYPYTLGCLHGKAPGAQPAP